MGLGLSKKFVDGMAVDIDKNKKGGPRFIGGTPATVKGVINEGKKFTDLIASGSSIAGNKIKQTGKAVENLIHNKSFPTKQQKIYNKKLAKDKWKNSPTRKKLIELENK